MVSFRSATTETLIKVGFLLMVPLTLFESIAIFIKFGAMRDSVMVRIMKRGIPSIRVKIIIYETLF